MGNLKKNDINELIYKTRKRLTDLKHELTVARGKGGGERIVREFGMDMCTLLYFYQQGPTVSHRELCSMFCSRLDGRGVWGRMDTCICMAESLCCLPETIKHC